MKIRTLTWVTVSILENNLTICRQYLFVHTLRNNNSISEFTTKKITLNCEIRGINLCFVHKAIGEFLSPIPSL